jgi:hypothetical protein
MLGTGGNENRDRDRDRDKEWCKISGGKCGREETQRGGAEFITFFLSDTMA